MEQVIEFFIKNRIFCKLAAYTHKLRRDKAWEYSHYYKVFAEPSWHADLDVSNLLGRIDEKKKVFLSLFQLSWLLLFSFSRNWTRGHWPRPSPLLSQSEAASASRTRPPRQVTRVTKTLGRYTWAVDEAAIM